MSARRSLKSSQVPAIVVVMLFIVAPFVLPSSLMTPLNYIGLYSIVCLGLVLMTGMAGLTSFGQAAFVGMGAYTSALLVTQYAWSPWMSLFAALAVSGLAALILGALTIRLSSHYLVLGTMAWGLSLFHLFGNVPALGGYNGIGNVPPIVIPGSGLSNQHTFYVMIWLTNGLMFLGVRNLLDSRQGRAIRSLRDGLMAQSFGVNVAWLKVLVFTMAALLAGLSGWLNVHYVSVANPGPFGIGASIDYLFMAVVGGTGSVAGALVGPALVETLRTVVRNVVPGFTGGGGSIETIIFGGVVILLLQGSGGGVMGPLVSRLRDPIPRGDSGRLRSGRALGLLASMRQCLVRTVPVAPAKSQALPTRTPPPKGSPLLLVKGLSKRFGGLLAVDGIDFDMEAGEILGVIGPNGAGKSTLFNLLTGVFAPSSGSASFQGRVITGIDPRSAAASGIARTFQHVRLRPDMTVLENAALGTYSRSRAGILRSALRLDRAEEARCLHEAQRQLDRVGLGDQASARAGSLALGQQRVLEIARALAADPLLLMLDEPAAGLRQQEKAHLARLLDQLRSEGVSILLVEHDMDFVMNLVDRLVVLQFGQLIARGSPADVQADPRVIEAYLGGMEAAA